MDVKDECVEEETFSSFGDESPNAHLSSLKVRKAGGSESESQDVPSVKSVGDLLGYFDNDDEIDEENALI